MKPSEPLFDLCTQAQTLQIQEVEFFSADLRLRPPVQEPTLLSVSSSQVWTPAPYVITDDPELLIPGFLSVFVSTIIYVVQK